MATNGLEWFRPMWRRVAVTAVCVVWSGWEWFYNHDQFWGTLTILLTGWAVWTFFITYDKNAGPPPDTSPPPAPPPQS